MSKKYIVRVGYLETNYVERDVLVEADTAREAEKKARAGDTIDEYEEDCCEPQEIWRRRVVKGYTGRKGSR